MNRERLLVIDDDVAVVSVLRTILTDEGFDVLTADSGFRGLEILQEATPDLIILDLKMPGMSGMGFLNEILGADGKPKYPVLVLTAHGTMSGFFQNIDIDGFMLKPLRGDLLVGKAVGQPRREGADQREVRKTAASSTWHGDHRSRRLNSRTGRYGKHGGHFKFAGLRGGRSGSFRGTSGWEHI